MREVSLFLRLRNTEYPLALLFSTVEIGEVVFEMRRETRDFD